MASYLKIKSSCNYSKVKFYRNRMLSFFVRLNSRLGRENYCDLSKTTERGAWFSRLCYSVKPTLKS